MPFCFVMRQNDLHLPIKRKIAASQPLAQILVNGGLADAKGGGGRADGRLMLDHVHSQNRICAHAGRL